MDQINNFDNKDDVTCAKADKINNMGLFNLFALS